MTYLLMTEIAKLPDSSGKYRATVSGLPEGSSMEDALAYAAVQGRMNATISEAPNREFWEEARNYISGYAEESFPGAYVTYHQEWAAL